MEIVSFLPCHWPRVREILLQNLQKNSSTFYHMSSSYPQWDTNHLVKGRLVCLDDSQRVCAWAALQVCPLLTEAETSVYVDPQHQGEGIGSLLMERLLQEAKAAGLSLLKARIFQNNLPSQKLQRKFGFHFYEIEKPQGKNREPVLCFQRQIEPSDEKPPSGKNIP